MQIASATAKLSMFLRRRFSACGSPPARASLRFGEGLGGGVLERDEQEAAESEFAGTGRG